MEHQHNSQLASPRGLIVYHPPVLRLLGALHQLTAGGSAGSNETMSGGTGINCGMNASRMC
jgi:hypothetical protein